MLNVVFYCFCVFSRTLTKLHFCQGRHEQTSWFHLKCSKAYRKGESPGSCIPTKQQPTNPTPGPFPCTSQRIVALHLVCRSFGSKTLSSSLLFGVHFITSFCFCKCISLEACDGFNLWTEVYGVMINMRSKRGDCLEWMSEMMSAKNLYAYSIAFKGCATDILWSH